MERSFEDRFTWKLDWNLLRTFMVVVDSQSVTRAGDFLGVTQPTISSALKRLEGTVGQRLIDRRPGNFEVTEAGRILYNEARAVFGTVSQIPGLVTATEGRISGEIRIAMTSHVVSPHFDQLLSDFSRTHPDTSYMFSIADSTEVMSRLRQNRASLGICLMREPDPSLRAQTLFVEYFGLYCGPHHRLFGRREIEISELQGEHSVSFQTETESGPLYSVAHLRERALLNSQVRGISANLPEVRRMIVAGVGVGALPVHVAERDVKLELLWQLPPYSDLPAVNVFAVRNPQRSMNPAEAAFVRQLDAMLALVPLSARTYSQTV